MVVYPEPRCRCHDPCVASNIAHPNPECPYHVAEPPRKRPQAESLLELLRRQERHIRSALRPRSGRTERGR
jgi:hypothetical protein